MLEVLRKGKRTEDGYEVEAYSYNGWKIVVSKITNKVITVKPAKNRKNRK